MAEAFRKIDIDAYDEDVLLESDLVDPDPRDPATVLSDAKTKSGQVRGFLSKGDIAGGLTMLLADAPYGPKVEDAKVRNGPLVKGRSGHRIPAVAHCPLCRMGQIGSYILCYCPYPQFHQGVRYRFHRSCALPGFARYLDEILVQGDGNAGRI
ncbi:hypothetical protein FRB93_003732 [Tulasnella sp. JGI-2019a]|nr:hypothetical protein FRB93_003732 [Tulasnella sp. JGI-2019a]